MAASDGHVIAPADGGPYDTCGHCGLPVQLACDGSGLVVTMIGANAECYGRPGGAR